MPPPTPAAIVQFISADGLSEKPQRLRAAILQALQKNTGLSNEYIAEYSEELEREVLKKLYEAQAADRDRGADPFLIIDETDGEPYVRGVDGPLLPIRKKLHNLDPTAFEHVCLDLLHHLGAKGEVTGGTADGGIDFHASGLSFQAPRISPIARSLVSVIGQAKRYKADNWVTVNELRQFVGAATLRVHEMRIGKSSYAALNPVVLAFWTTSDFNASAVEYANKVGMWILNGRALAQLIIQTKYQL